MENQIVPCKECITFPICKNQLFERIISDNEKVTMMSVVTLLCKKCTILEESLTRKRIPGESKRAYVMGELLNVLKVFNEKPD